MSVLRDLYRGKTNIEFIGRRNIWFALSAVVFAVSIGSMLFRTAESPCTDLFKGLNCGIEFKGGIEIRAPIDESSPLVSESDTGVITEVRDTLTPLGAEDAQIQVAGADVGGDVAGTQVEELDRVVGVLQHQLASLALPVAGLGQHQLRGVGQRALVGHGDLEHLGGLLASHGRTVTGGRSQVGVDVVEGKAAREHQHLHVVEQLAQLLGGALATLVLGGHPGLGRLLDQLLADRVHALVQRGHRARAVRPGARLLGKLVEELVERLHGGP